MFLSAGGRGLKSLNWTHFEKAVTSTAEAKVEIYWPNLLTSHMLFTEHVSRQLFETGKLICPVARPKWYQRTLWQTTDGGKRYGSFRRNYVFIYVWISRRRSSRYFPVSFLSHFLFLLIVFSFFCIPDF